MTGIHTISSPMSQGSGELIIEDLSLKWLLFCRQTANFEIRISKAQGFSPVSPAS